MKLLFKDKTIRYSFWASLVLNLLVWVLFVFRMPVSDKPIVLGYNIYVGINFIGPWYNIFYFSLAGLLIIALNFILIKKIFKMEKLLAQFFAVGALICQVILMIYGVLIAVINY